MGRLLRFTDGPLEDAYVKYTTKSTVELERLLFRCHVIVNIAFNVAVFREELGVGLAVCYGLVLVTQGVILHTLPADLYAKHRYGLLVYLLLLSVSV